MGRGNIASASKDELVLVALKGVCSGYVYKPVTAVSPPCNQERLWPQRAWVTVYVIQVKRPCPTIIQGGDSFAGEVVLGGCFWLRPWRSAAKGVEIAIAERQGASSLGLQDLRGLEVSERRSSSRRTPSKRWPREIQKSWITRGLLPY